MMTFTAKPTNREKLMAELNALPNVDFYLMLADNKIKKTMDDSQCDYCKAKFGRCVSVDDDTLCPVSLSEWLDQPNPGKRILPAT